MRKDTLVVLWTGRRGRSYGYFSHNKEDQWRPTTGRAPSTSHSTLCSEVTILVQSFAFLCSKLVSPAVATWLSSRPMYQLPFILIVLFTWGGVIVYLFLEGVRGMEPRTLCILSMHSTT